MKVTASQQPSAESQNTRPARLQGGEMPGVESNPAAAGTRSFASVLDSTPSAGEGPDAEPGKEIETTKQQAPAVNREEHKSVKRDEVEMVSVPLAMVQPDMPVDEAPDLSAPPTAREILPTADLENILLSVRTEIVAGGQPQTVIDLPRSMLEGLRVKLSTDRTGRISAEFVARTEEVRAQVDARSTDLVDMLRFRGINLAALSTSVGAEMKDGDDSRRRQPPAETHKAANRTDAIGDSSSNSGNSRQAGDSDDGFTYRA